jgi:colanic acid/amylovoran biosynthesis glycosyltransferase
MLLEKWQRRNDKMTNSSDNKIGYLVNSFPSYSETFILNEMDELERHGLSIRCFSLSRDADIIHDLAKKWFIRTHWAPSLFSPVLWLAHLHFALTQPKKYFYALRHNRDYGGKKDFIKAVYFASVVEDEGIRHMHAQFGWCAGAAMLIAFLAGAEYSFTMHHADIFYGPPFNMTHLVNNSRFCVTISQFNKRFLIGHWPDINSENIHVIRCGVDINKFVPINKNTDINRDVKLLNVARLVELKNISFLIRICEQLRERGYRYICTIVGDGPKRNNLERQIRELDLEDRIILKGAMAQEDIVSFYQHADIFILTSKSEGIPVVTMEALASGLPVVAPDITGIPELVIDGQTGFLFPEGSLEQATNAVAKLVKGPDLRSQIGFQGRKKVINEYNSRVNVGQLAKLFLKC